MKSRSLNICIVSRVTTDHSFGGMEHYIARLANGLAERGNKVHILTTALPGQASSKTVYKKKGNITTCFIENTRPASYRNGFFRKAYRLFCALNARKKFDLVHGMSAAAHAFAGKLSIPLITTLFGVSYSETPYQPLIFPHLNADQKMKFLLKLPKIAVSMRLMHAAAGGSDATIVISDYAQRELKHIKPYFPHEKVTRIYCGVEICDFKVCEKEIMKKKLGLQAPVILAAGRIELQKGIHILLEAWGQLKPERGTLIVVGHGSYLPELQKMAHKAQLSSCVFTGKVPFDTFRQYMAAADIFIYPELTQPAFGLVAAEAMSYATPVIGSHHGAIPEVVGDAGLLFYPGNPADLADQLRYALANPDVCEYLGQKGYTRVRERFSIDIMVSETLALYWQHVKQKRRSE